jgi:glucan phosphoethanolaminetransferase (alkaline phosphatase superfamily)
MPKRLYLASTAYAGAHISANMWLWIIISAIVTAVLCVLYWMNQHSNIWAHLLVLSGMVCGTLVMVQSQVGYVSPYAVADDEEEVVTPPTPRA